MFKQRPPAGRQPAGTGAFAHNRARALQLVTGIKKTEILRVRTVSYGFRRPGPAPTHRFLGGPRGPTRADVVGSGGDGRGDGAQRAGDRIRGPPTGHRSRDATTPGLLAYTFALVSESDTYQRVEEGGERCALNPQCRARGRGARRALHREVGTLGRQGGTHRFLALSAQKARQIS